VTEQENIYKLFLILIGGDPGGSGVDPGDPSASKNGGGLFRPLVVLAGVNLFRRFSSQYRRLPQEPPKDRLEQELERLNNKIVSEHKFYPGINSQCFMFTHQHYHMYIITFTDGYYRMVHNIDMSLHT
jgi:hypothetical protein